jgi:amino acid adenylation domain-containing protein
MDQLSDHDRQQIFSWNQDVPNPISLCVHDIFAQRVEEQPDAQAVQAWDGEWTYSELDQHSSALARVLLVSGVMGEGFVPLWFDKSKWTAVAVLGVLKAGGAFAFLDPQHPADRLRRMCGKIDARLLLVSSSQSKLAKAVLTDIVMVILNDDLFATAQSMNASLDISVQPHQAAYVAFTSGSTGVPKGAVIRHDALVTGLLLTQKAFCLKRTSRVLNFAAFAFDANIYEHFWALLVGGCLCIPSEDDRLGNLELAIQRLRVTWAFFTPSLGRLLEPQRLSSLEVLIMGGEAMTQKDLDTWSPVLQLVNLYGPAECAIAVTLQPMRQSIPPCIIGCSYAVTCWVVDETDSQQLVPVGTAGELVLEGPALSQEYINDPEQTAKAFITNPKWLPAERFSSRRLYKTGDIVRYNPNGSLYILGRKDMQVKIHGQRIELGEVEHHARNALYDGAHEVIVEVVILPRRPTSLVVFIFMPDLEPTANSGLIQWPKEAFWKHVSDIKTLLFRYLPGYMVPDLYFPIASIPHTMTGKVNRKRLREEVGNLPEDRLRLYLSSSREDTVFEYPRNKEEQTLQLLWSQILSLPLDQISRRDNWVRLGGDSLLAMKLVGYARKEGYLFNVAHVMQNRTIAALARVIRHNHFREVDQNSKTVSLKPFALLAVDPALLPGFIQIAADQCQVAPDRIEDIYPCTREHYWMIPREPGQIDYTLRVEAEIDADLDLDRLSEAWSTTVAANPMLRSRVVELSQGQFFYAVLPDVIPLDFNSAERKEQYRHGCKLWQLARPLLYIAVEKDRFVILIHHLLYDAYSVPLIFRNIERAYQGQPLPITPYRPFRQALGEDQEVKQQFWTQRFRGWTGSTFPPLKEGGGSPLETRILHRKMPIYATDFTASTTLHLALAVTISWALNNARDIVFGTVSSRRGVSVPDVQGIIAPISALLPTRIQLDPELTIRKHLNMVQDNSLEAMVYELVDSRIFEGLGGELATALRYQTLFAVQPDIPTDDMSLFRNIRMQYDDGPTFMWNLGLQCFLSPKSVRMSMHISEPTIRDETDWDSFANRFCTAFDCIQQQPELNLYQVFHKMATASLCWGR